MRRRRTYVAVAIAVIFSGCGPSEVRAPRKHAADYHLAIVLFSADPLHPEANRCESVTVPSYLAVAKNDKITWDIVNLCGNDKNIEVKDFVGDDDPSHKDPLDPDASSDPKRRLIFKVKGNAASDIYKYRVYRDGVLVEDPEIYVER